MMFKEKPTMLTIAVVTPFRLITEMGYCRVRTILDFRPLNKVQFTFGERSHSGLVRRS